MDITNLIKFNLLLVFKYEYTNYNMQDLTIIKIQITFDIN